MLKDKVQMTLLFVVLVVLMLFALFPQKPEPVRQSPLPEAPRMEIVQERAVTIIPFRRVQPCIFNEGIEGCRYNDRLGRKEGPDAYKWYDMSEVLWKRAR